MRPSAQLELEADQTRTCGTCQGPVAWRDVRPDGLCTPCRRLAFELELEQRALATLPSSMRDWAVIGAPALQRAVTGELVVLALVDAILSRCRVTFRGPTKVGKTSLASACFRAFVERRRPGWKSARYERARDLGLARKNHGLGHEAPDVERAMECGLLVIDDLGNETCPEKLECLPDILDARHAENLPTWVTTGLSDEQLAHRYGEAIRRRLLQSDGGDLLLVVPLGRPR